MITNLCNHSVHWNILVLIYIFYQRHCVDFCRIYLRFYNINLTFTTLLNQYNLYLPQMQYSNTVCIFWRGINKGTVTMTMYICNCSWLRFKIQRKEVSFFSMNCFKLCFKKLFRCIITQKYSHCESSFVLFWKNYDKFRSLHWCCMCESHST